MGGEATPGVQSSGAVVLFPSKGGNQAETAAATENHGPSDDVGSQDDPVGIPGRKRTKKNNKKTCHH